MGKKRTVGDPYLRDRVIFSEESNSLKKWVVVFSILGLVSIVGIGSLYFPELTANIKSYLKIGTASNQTDNKDSSLPASNKTSTPAPDLKTPEVSKSSSESTVTTEVSSINIPPQSSTETKPSETKVAVSSKESTNSESELSVKTTTETVSEQSTETSVEIATSDSSQTSADVEKLLTTAKKQIKQLRFTTPEGNNAYETYQTVAKISPDQAAPILDEIIGWYFDRGEKLLERKRVLQPTQKNAYEMYRKMQEIAPQHAGSKALLENVLSALEKQASEQIDSGKLIKPKGNNAQKTYQAMHAIAPDHEKTQKISNTILNPLFEKAEQQIQKRKFTTPKNDSALSTYREILVMFPENERAKTGIKKIAEEYYVLALKNEKQGHYLNSLLMIERGLKIAPDDSNLLTLKKKIKANQ